MWRTLRRLALLTTPAVLLSVSSHTTADAQGGAYPQPCPLQLTDKFLGIFPFRHAGYEWTGKGNDTWNGWWQLVLGIIDGMKEHEAYYWPYGTSAVRQIMSDDNKAVWKQAALVVDCRRYEWTIAGILHVETEYHVTQYHGTVVEVECAGSGGTGGTALRPYANPYSENYDPYATAEPWYSLGATTAGCGGGDEASSGSGTYYQPGDLTGGETVDWQTGRGNGGASLCGAAALVEYVCIDTWTGEGWAEWGCGYATTC